MKCLKQNSLANELGNVDILYFEQSMSSSLCVGFVDIID